jgi:hypothetical protein
VTERTELTAEQRAILEALDRLERIEHHLDDPYVLGELRQAIVALQQVRPSLTFLGSVLAPPDA